MHDLDLINNKLRSLRSEGLFVTIVQKEDYFIIECKVYITDHDDETGTTNILEIWDNELRDENEKCLGCKSFLGEVRQGGRGCISCPLGCGSFTRPYALTEKVYRTKLGATITSNMPPQIASTISAALR